MDTINKPISRILSTNIERDFDKDIQYIVTQNTQDIFDNIVTNFQTGLHSFNIIGSYGTGKSTFLWALEKNLTQQKNLFQLVDENTFPTIETFDFFKLVGEAKSLKQCFIEKLKISANDNIFDALSNYYTKLAKNKTGLVILIDEFGKFLEYATVYNPDEELYFIQQLAEFCNDSSKNILFISTLHQNFSAYSSNLTSQQKNEWVKVKGRLQELAFNEPVDQLLFFVKKRIKELDFDSSKSNSFEEITELIQSSKLTDTHRNFDNKVVSELFPFDYLAIEILTKALQKYGQNERSLFSFLDSTDKLAIRSFDKNGTIYSLANVSLFLEKNFHTYLWTKENIDYSQWISFKIAVEKTTTRLDKELVDDAITLLRIINLITLFTNKGGNANHSFLTNYLRLTLHSLNFIEILKELEDKKIIKYIDYNTRFIFSDGTDLDIDEEIRNAGQELDGSFDLVDKLKSYFKFPYVCAKSFTYQTGTPRFFQYKLSSKSILKFDDKQEVDGIINLIFSNELLETYQTVQNEPILYAVYNQYYVIKQIVFEIDKIAYVLKNCDPSDKVARRELESRKIHETQKLYSLILESLYNEKMVSWYYNGELITIYNSKKLNKQLSIICEDVYNETPIFKNELVNKEKNSTAISTARKSYEIALMENSSKEDLAFSKEKFPPEKSVYLTLLQKTGIHQQDKNGNWKITNPTEQSFDYLWKISNDFLNESIGKKNSLVNFITKLSKRPLKLKKGFINFWLPTFLIIKQEEYALFNDAGYIPNLTSDVLALIHKSPQKFSIKKFNVSNVNINLFETYQAFLRKGTSPVLTLTNNTQSHLISTIRPFIVFYRELSPYTQKTKKLTPATLNIREAISKAEDLENVLFEKFPKALGYNITLNENINLEEYTNKLEETIKELRGCFDELINRIEESILLALGIAPETKYEDYKETIVNRFQRLNRQGLIPQQKTLAQRLIAPIDKRIDWIKGIANAIIGKSLENILDEEEAFICNNLTKMLKTLETSVEIHVLQESRVNDEIISFEIITSQGKKESSKIIISNSENIQQEINTIQESLKSKTKEEQKAIIAKIYQNIISND